MQGSLTRRLFLVVLLANVAACASISPLPIPSESQRSRYGTVGVVSVKSPPDAGFEGLPVGVARGAAGGAVAGAGVSALAGAYTAVEAAAVSGVPTSLLLPVILPPLAIAGAIVGSVAGVAMALPAETAALIEQDIKQALLEAEPQTRLRRNIVAIVRREALPAVEGFAEASPDAPGTTADHVALREAGIDTALEVGIMKVGLVGRRGGADLLLSLHSEASVRLVNTETGDEIYSRTAFIATRPARTFPEWGANGAVLLREEIDALLLELARDIVDEIFLVVR